MKEILEDIVMLLAATLLMLLMTCGTALSITVVTFLAWDIVISPVLGLPALTFGQIFICAWAFMFIVSTVLEIKYVFDMLAEETEVESEDDNDEKY